MPWDKPTEGWSKALKTSQPGFTQNTFDFLVNPTAISPEICRVKVDDELAQPWTVTLNPVYPGAEIGQAGLNIGSVFDGDNRPQNVLTSFAQITFGRGGVQTDVIVDWPSTGQVITVFGSFIQVKGAIVRLGDTFSPRPETLQQFLTAHITPGRQHSPRPVYRTLDLPDLSIVSETVPVPRFAKTVLFGCRNQIVFNDLEVEMEGLDSPLATAAVRWIVDLFPAFSNNTPSPYPLPNGTNFIRVQNIIGSPEAVAPWLLFELDF